MQGMQAEASGCWLALACDTLSAAMLRASTQAVPALGCLLTLYRAVISARVRAQAGSSTHETSHSW